MEELTAVILMLIWNGLTITEERQKQMLFTAPYIQDRQIIVVLPDSDIKTKAIWPVKNWHSGGQQCS